MFIVLLYNGFAVLKQATCWEPCNEHFQLRNVRNVVFSLSVSLKNF